MRPSQANWSVPTIPFFFGDDGDDEKKTTRVSRNHEPHISPDAPMILVVDDDLANLALAEALLQAEGFRVRVAIDAATTLDILATEKPSLILMDIQLPEVDGWELTKRLKSDPATKDIPVVAITAYGKSGDEEKARRAGFVQFLAKPISTRELPAIIRRHLAAS